MIMSSPVRFLRGIFDFHALLVIVNFTYDLVPKGVQEKRTEVLENKVDRM